MTDSSWNDPAVRAAVASTARADWQRRFNAWMTAANLAVTARIGFSGDDLADQTWADWFDAGMTPDEAAQEALENEGMGDL